jgi:tetratricopeptide (TPR) repeat protein
MAKKCGVKNGSCVKRGLRRDRLRFNLHFLPDIFLPHKRSLIAPEDARQVLPMLRTHAYLKMLRRKQDNFNQNFYDIKRPFDQQQRLGDLADLMIEVGVQKFTDHRVSEICRDLIRNEKDAGKARNLYFAMLERAPTAGNSMYSMSNIMGSARDILTDRESVERTAVYLIKASVGGTTWQTLFNGYSTSSDGRHNNVTTYFVRHVTANDDNALLVETMLRAKLDEQPDWQEGKIWLGILLTARKQFDEAKELIEPLLSPDIQPEPTHDILWLVGSLIDAHQPMHDLAERIYEHALKNTTDRSDREFKYSLKGRVCNFMADIGNNDRAREMALEALEQAKTTPSRNSSNAEYEAYRKIESTMGMMDFLAKIEFPSDALRVAREFDKSLFVKAGRYERGRREQFDKKQIELLEKVREMGGLATVHSMINAKSDGPAAVDFGITPGNRPFTDHALSSLWMELVEEAGKDPTQTDPFKAFVDDMKTLAMQRPDDDSAAAAYAVAADVSGDIQPLRDLIAQWIDDLEGDSAVENPKLRNRLLMVSLLRLDRSDPGNDPTDDRKRVAGIKLGSSAGMSAVDVTYFLAGLSKQTLSREDLETTRRLWEYVIGLNSSFAAQSLCRRFPEVVREPDQVGRDDRCQPRTVTKDNCTGENLIMDVFEWLLPPPIAAHRDTGGGSNLDARRPHFELMIIRRG